MHVLSRKRLASAALVLSLSTVCANISFVRIPPTILQPGETIELQWNIATPTAGTLDTSEPFNLQLRALSGQRYDLNKLIPQTAAKLRVVIPKEATGGLHSFYADYTGPINVKPTASNQFNITGAIIVPTIVGPTSTLDSTASITAPHGKSTPSSQTSDSQAATDEGLSGGAIGGIIAGVVIFLLLIALIFFARHRRLERERNQHTRLDDSKESYSETATARSGPPSAKGGDGMVSVPLSAPAPVYPSPFSDEPKPQPQHPMNQMQHASGSSNPFDAPEDRTRGLPPVGAMAMGAVGSPRSLSPRQQHQPYQPPHFEQQPPRPQQQQYGVPLQQRSQSPFQQGSSGRDSFESEPESAYDPAHARMMPHPAGGNGNGPVVRNNSNPMMQRGPGSQLAYSPSGRSVMSDAQNTPHPQPHPHQQQQNPFQERELLAAAAGGAAVGAIAAANHRQGSPAPNSPAQAHRHLTPMNDSRVQTPLPGQGSPLPRSKEIEMQPLDVQQHQYEQQQRMLQRQQQQRQQAEAQAQAGHQQQPQQQLPVQPIQQTPLPPTPVPASTPAPAAASHPFNPTLYDDKTEIDDDGMPVYNGYRDTIFGAYSQPLEGSDDDEDDETAVPVVPTLALVSAGGDAQKQQQPATDSQASSSGAGAGVQRKKSVKFTGVPLSGSIDIPVSTSQQQQHQQQLYHSDDDDDDEDEEDEMEDEDEDDIKMRLMQTEVPSPASAHARPSFINTTPGSSPSTQHHQASVLSPVRSPDQAYPSSSGNYHQSHGNHRAIGGGFPVPAPIPASAPKQHQQQQHQQQQSSSHATGSSSPSLNTASSSFGNGFYEDVLAAVDKNSKSLPSSSTTAANNAAPLQKHQPVRVDQEVFGAPSPRVSAAVATPAHQQHLKNSQQPSMPKPYQQPSQQQQQQQHEGEHNGGFYESPLL